MSATHSKPSRRPFIQQIRKARKSLKSMSAEKKIDLMVLAGVLTPAQADKAKKKLVEAQDVPLSLG